MRIPVLSRREALGWAGTIAPLRRNDIFRFFLAASLASPLAALSEGLGASALDPLKSSFAAVVAGILADQWLFGGGSEGEEVDGAKRRNPDGDGGRQDALHLQGAVLGRRAANYAFRVSQTVLEWKAASGRERKRAVSYAVRAGDRFPSARLCREDWLSFPWRFTL